MMDIALIEALVAGTALLEFASALVTQPANSNSERRQGTASVTQSESGDLRLKVNISGRVDLARALQSIFSTVSGRLIEEDEFYRLEATRNQSEIWVCERFLGDDRPSYEANGSTMTGVLVRLSMKSTALAPQDGHHLYQ